MLKIRLKRTGRKGKPHYRVVVMEATKPRDGRTVAEIGYYNPRLQPSVFEIDKEEAKKWLEHGAQPTDTVRAYFVKLGLLKPKKKGSTKPKGKKKKKASEEASE